MIVAQDLPDFESLLFDGFDGLDGLAFEALGGRSDAHPRALCTATASESLPSQCDIDGSALTQDWLTIEAEGSDGGSLHAVLALVERCPLSLALVPLTLKDTTQPTGVTLPREVSTVATDSYASGTRSVLPASCIVAPSPSLSLAPSTQRQPQRQQGKKRPSRFCAALPVNSLQACGDGAPRKRGRPRIHVDGAVGAADRDPLPPYARVDAGRFNGTSFRAKRRKWQAQVTVKGFSKKVSLGDYADKHVAAAAFNLGRTLLTQLGYRVKLAVNDGVPPLSDAVAARVRGLVQRWLPLPADA